MTPEEERMMRAQVAQLLGGQPGMQPGMTAPATDSKRQLAEAMMGVSTGGLKGRIAMQQQMANELRGRQMPQGRRVGPSNIYVAPNWGESLGAGVERLAGAYMSGKLGEQYDRLGELETTQRLGEEMLKDVRTTEDRAFTAGQNALTNALKRELSQADITARAEEGEATRAVTRRGQNLTATAAANREQGLRDRSNEVGTYERPDGSTFSVVTVPGEGVFMYDRTQPGGRGEPADLTGAIPLDTTATGSTTAMDTLQERQRIADKSAQFESEQATNQLIGSLDTEINAVDRILSNTALEDFSGFTNPRRIGAIYGLGPDAWRGQNLDMQLRMATMDTFGSLADIFKPLSEGEGRRIDKMMPDLSKEPEATAAWFGTVGRDELNKMYQDRRASARTEEEKANLDRTWKAVNDKLNLSVAKAGLRFNIPPERAAELGMDEDELKLLYVLLRRQNGSN